MPSGKMGYTRVCFRVLSKVRPGSQKIANRIPCGLKFQSDAVWNKRVYEYLSLRRRNIFYYAYFDEEKKLIKVLIIVKGKTINHFEKKYNC